MQRVHFSAPDEHREKLSFGFAGIGCQYKQEHVKRPNGREETEWIYPFFQWLQCRHGEGVIILGGKEYIVSEGQGILLFPNAPHEYYARSDEWEVDWIIFEGNHIEHFFKDVMQASTSGIYAVSTPKKISALIAKLMDIAQSADPMKYILASSVVYELLLYIYIHTSGEQGPSLANKADRLRPVFEYVEQHYHEQIPLEVLAQLILITPQHLCVIFKNLTGRTITEHINSIRIGKSKELLLKNRTMLIKEIAINCGFSDVSYFCSTFKRFEGISPAVFRERG